MGTTNVQDAAARAKQLIAERKYQDAVRACRRVLLSRPDEVEVRLLLAQALLALGRHDEVRIEMLALSRKAPEIGAIHRLLGEAYIRGGQPESAAAALREALRLDPDDDEARDLLEEVGEVEESVPGETIERWFEEDPTSVESLSSHAPAPAPATAPSGAVPPSVELDAGFAAEASGETALPPVKPKKSMKETLMGLPAPGGGIAPPPTKAPSLPPPPPPGAGRPSARPPSMAGSMGAPSAPPPSGLAPPPGRPKRKPKATMLGMPMAPRAAPPAAAAPPVAAPPVAPAPVAPAPAPVAPPMQPSSTEDLDSGALEMVEDGGTEEISTHEILQKAASGTEELSSMEIAFSQVDPYEDLDGGLPPLEGEATQAGTFEEMEPLVGEATQGGLEEERTRARAAAPGAPDFDDEATRGGKKDGLAPARPAGAPPTSPPHTPPASDFSVGFHDPFDDETTTRAASVSDDDLPTSTHAAAAGFPDVGLDGQPLPELAPLDGEATMAKAPVASPAARPSLGRSAAGMPGGFAPTAAPGSPVGPGSAVPGGPPVGPATLPPGAPPGPPGPPGATPMRGGLTGLTQRLPPWAGKPVKFGRKQVPLYLAIALAGIPVLVLVLTVVIVQSYLSSAAEEEIAALTVEASRNGLEASLRGALERDADELDDDATSIARRARLYAMATYEHGYPETERTRGLLGELDDTERGLADAKVAMAYLALEEGAVGRARELAVIADPSEIAGEAAHARALTAMLVADHERALAEVDQALAQQPGAARYAALKARTLSAAGQGDEALAVFEQVAAVEREPTALIARAEVRLEQGDANGALEDATSVLEELHSSVSVRQRAWTELTQAQALAALGRNEDAARVLAAIGDGRPTASEAFTLRVAATQMKLGDLDAARTALEQLPEEVARSSARAVVASEIHLAAGDLAGMERVLADAPEGAQKQYLRGRLAEARGERVQAEEAYRAAAADPEQFVRATLRLGGLALSAGEAGDAEERLAPAVQREPSHPELVPMMVDALLRQGKDEEAARVAQTALSAAPEEPALVIAKARADLAAGDARAVLELLSAWVERRPQDATLHATLGEAARQLGEVDRARQAFDRALAIAPRNVTALGGKVELALFSGEPEAVASALEAARAAGAPDADAQLWQARAMLLEGKGQEVVTLLRRRMPYRGRGRRRRPQTRQVEDANLAAAYGLAIVQSENERMAREARQWLERAVSLEEQHVDANLGLALLSLRSGDLGGASQSIGNAARGAKNDWQRARVAAMRARRAFESGDMSRATELADEAKGIDERASEAHLVLALVADVRGGNPVPHLRRALAGRMPTPEVFGQLVLFDDRNDAICAIAQRYVAAAPRGIDARDARAVASGCR